MIEVVELFAGVGGFRLGLEGLNKDRGFEVIWGNQWEPSTKVQHAFDCYARNFKTGIHVNKDISTVDVEDIPKHDLLVGGFPCQDYSVARSLSGEQGIRGKKGVLFWEIMRIVNGKKPAFVLLENVDRLLKSPSSQRGKDFAVMLASFRDAGYSVEWRVINAADYGFAQRRRRVFIFAYRNDTEFGKTQFGVDAGELIHSGGFFASKFPIEEESSLVHLPFFDVLPDDIVEVSDTFSARFRNAGIMRNGSIYTEEIIPQTVAPITLGDILETNVSDNYFLNNDEVTKNGMTVLEQFTYMKGPKRIERESSTGHKYVYSEGGMSFPDLLDLPGRTMLTSEGTKNRSTHVVEDPERPGCLRILTPIECERLNGFPDNWTKGMPERNRYFCMGNALVVGLIEIMGEKIREIYQNEYGVVQKQK
ncbi:DNA (cytosine-5-)-methyltransferase [Neobacillus sp. D3-1R]|uniref:DNA (cytosine-5-)-methyltransferase n=1 Tax=Neobacillus sp. D3-1R TaxID=3445778 RepID=UPI003F9F7E98